MNQKKFIEFKLPVDMMAGSVIFIDPTSGKPFVELNKREREGAYFKTGIVAVNKNGREYALTDTQKGILKALEWGRKNLFDLQKACLDDNVPVYNAQKQATALMKHRCVTRRKGKSEGGRKAYVYSITKVGRKVLEEFRSQ